MIPVMIGIAMGLYLYELEKQAVLHGIELPKV